MNNERHYLVMISVAKCSDRHYILPQISLPRSDIHYSFFTENCLIKTLPVYYFMHYCTMLKHSIHSYDSAKLNAHRSFLPYGRIIINFLIMMHWPLNNLTSHPHRVSYHTTVTVSMHTYQDSSYST